MSWKPPTLLGLISSCLFFATNVLAASEEFTLLENQDLPGEDLLTPLVDPGLKNSSLEICKVRCQVDSACVAFTFDARHKWCFLKAGLPVPSFHKGAISGIRVSSAPSVATSDNSIAAQGEQLYYGSRAGMTVTVVSKSGIGTENAVISVEHRPEDAKGFCVGYLLDNSMQCVRRTLAGVVVEPQVSANCLTRTWLDLGGEQYALVGRRKPPDEFVRYDIKHVAGGEILDGSSASGYGTVLSIFQALCPGVAD